MPSTHVNIDGDVLRYSAGFAAEGEPLPNLLATLRSMIKDIVKASKATTYTVLLTRKGNFREEIATLQPYKGNRKGSRKPDNYEESTEYLIMHQHGWFVDGEEADDQLGIRCIAHGHTIATIDKDLDNVPGWHYNWQKKSLYYVNERDAMLNFYKQLITGDATDHIPGLYKLTGCRATAKRKAMIEDCLTAAQCYATVLSIYDDCTDEPLEVIEGWLLEIGRLLWIRWYDGEMWTPPATGEKE